MLANKDFELFLKMTKNGTFQVFGVFSVQFSTKLDIWTGQEKSRVLEIPSSSRGLLGTPVAICGPDSVDQIQEDNNPTEASNKLSGVSIISHSSSVINFQACYSQHASKKSTNILNGFKK